MGWTSRQAQRCAPTGKSARLMSGDMREYCASCRALRMASPGAKGLALARCQGQGPRRRRPAGRPPAAPARAVPPPAPAARPSSPPAPCSLHQPKPKASRVSRAPAPARVPARAKASGPGRGRGEGGQTGQARVAHVFAVAHASPAGERPICSDCARSSLLSRVPRTQSFSAAAPSLSWFCQAAWAWASTGSSLRASESSSWSRPASRPRRLRGSPGRRRRHFPGLPNS